MLRRVGELVGINSRADFWGAVPGIGTLTGIVNIGKERRNLRELRQKTFEASKIGFEQFKTEHDAITKRMTRRVFELLPVVGILAYAIVQVARAILNKINPPKVEDKPPQKVEDKPKADRQNDKNDLGCVESENTDFTHVDDIPKDCLFILEHTSYNEGTKQYNTARWAFDLSSANDTAGLEKGINIYVQDGEMTPEQKKAYATAKLKYQNKALEVKNEAQRNFRNQVQEYSRTHRYGF